MSKFNPTLPAIDEMVTMWPSFFSNIFGRNSLLTCVRKIKFDNNLFSELNNLQSKIPLQYQRNESSFFVIPGWVTDKGDRQNLLTDANSCIDFVRFAELIEFTEFPLHLGKTSLSMQLQFTFQNRFCYIISIHVCSPLIYFYKSILQFHHTTAFCRNYILSKLEYLSNGWDTLHEAGTGTGTGMGTTENKGSLYLSLCSVSLYLSLCSV